jgi:hypothetical protein
MAPRPRQSCVPVRDRRTACAYDPSLPPEKPRAPVGTFDAILILVGTPQKEATMSAEEADKTLKQDLEDTRNDLKRAADEIRVKMHLAGMDAKDAWDEIQPRLEDFERRFDAKADEVSDELKALGSDIKQRLLNIKAKLKSE